MAVLVAVAGLVVVWPTSAASAQTSGPENFTGFLAAARPARDHAALRAGRATK